MRRTLLILLIIVGFVIIGLAVAVATFDVDRFRPQVINHLERALGRPVQLERIALGWQGGIAVQLKGFVIPASSEPLFAVASAGAVLRLRPLLRKQLEVSSVVLERPRVHVVRDAEGRLNLLGLAAIAGPVAAPSGTTTVGGRPVSFSIGSFRIQDGSLHVELADPRRPVEVWLRQVDVTITDLAPGQAMDVTLSGALASDRPNLRLSGRLTPPADGQAGSVERLTVSLEELPIEQLLPPSPPGSPRLRGRLTVSLDGHVATLHPARLAEAVTGQGTVRLNGLTLEELNLVRDVFERLSMIPGLVQRLEERLSPEDRAMLAARDTTFAPLEAAIRVQDGAVRIEAVELRTGTFRLAGSGQVAFNGAVQLHAILRISPGLSAACIKGVEELRYLTNAQGELELPVAVQGQATQLAVLPDLHYVASKVLVSKAQDVLSGFLQQALQEFAPASPAPEGSAQ